MLISDLRLLDCRSLIWMNRSEIGSSSICNLRSSVFYMESSAIGSYNKPGMLNNGTGRYGMNRNQCFRNGWPICDQKITDNMSNSLISDYSIADFW